MQQVSDLADAQCDAAVRQGGGQPVPMPMTQVQQRSSTLLEIELTRQYAASQDLEADPRIVDVYWSQYRTAVEQLPATPVRSSPMRSATSPRSAPSSWRPAQHRQSPPPTTSRPDPAGLDARRKWVDAAEVHTDPRFGPDEHGFPGGGDGSVSRPVSDFARKATAAQADPAWVSSLPAGQKCG